MLWITNKITMPLALSSNNSIPAGAPPCSEIAGNNGWTAFSKHLSCVSNSPACISEKDSSEGDKDRPLITVGRKSLLLNLSRGGSVSIGDKPVISLEQQRHPLAIFGVSHKQRASVRFVNRELLMVNVHTIAHYNHRLGLIHYGRDEDPYYKRNEKLFNKVSAYIINISEKRLVNKGIAEKILSGKRLGKMLLACGFEREIYAWAYYLYANKDKLDPIARLNALLNKSAIDEHREIIDQFILKNTDVECDTGTLAGHLLYLIQERGCTTSAELKQALRAYRKKNGNSLFSKAAYLDLSELYMKHFFRNTSKLGLEFFACRGHDIAFAWDTGKGVKLNFDTVLEKPWEAGARRNKQFEPITYSEIRAVWRNKRDRFAGINVFKLFVIRDYAEIADSLTSDSWAMIRR